MKRVASTILLLSTLLLVAATASADFPQQPDHAVMVNSFHSVLSVNEHLVALTQRGVTVCDYDDQHDVFIPGPLYLLDGSPMAAKISGDSSYVVTHTDNSLYVFDASQLPELVLVSEFEFPEPFADFAVSGDVLYLAQWFDGIQRYHLDYGQGTSQHTGGSLYPVLAVQVDIHGNSVYVLDEYNGVMRWDVSDTSFGSPQELLVQKRARHFFKHGDLFYLPLVHEENFIFIGEFGHDGSGVIDTIEGAAFAERVFFVDNRIVIVSPLSVYVVETGQSLAQATMLTKSIRGHRTAGTIHHTDPEPSLVLPGEQTGLSVFDLNSDVTTEPALYRNGPIDALDLYRGHLMTATGAGPVDIYRVDSLTSHLPDYTLGSRFDSLHAMCRNGDTLIVVHSWPPVLSLVRQATSSDFAAVEGSTAVATGSIRGLRYVTHTDQRAAAVILWTSGRVEIYSLVAQGNASHSATIEYKEGITTCEVVDNHLLVATDHSRLYLNTITNDLQIQQVTVGDAPATVTALAMLPSQAYAFAGNHLLMIDLIQPAERLVDSVTYPVPIAFDATIDNNRLLTVGPQGIAIYRLGYSAPELIDQGGLPGHMLAAEDGYLVSSDGSAGYVYRLPQYSSDAPDPETLPVLFTLSQNYPNPFNATTTIRFSLTSRADVELVVYNVLGQEVTRLIDGPVERGPHTAVWSGTNSAGKVVASGVYFYRLRLGDRVESRKMMLLK